MDNSERLVERYLLSRGFKDVAYEPDGNVTPDFLIDGRIAVEVRRLNQNVDTDRGPVSLETTAAPLAKVVAQVLAEVGRPRTGPSWFVIYTFRRPLPSLKKLRSSLKAALLEFSTLDSPEAARIEVDAHFSIRLVRASKAHDHLFVQGGSSDNDSGGFVVSEMTRNLAICFEQKGPKVAKVRHQYPEWWFVLVDYIGCGLDADERLQLRELLTIDAPWDKVILINPEHPESGFEL